MGTERKRSCLVSPRIINTNGAAIQLAETADGEPALVLQDRTVREVYLGAEVEATEPGRVTH